MRSEPDEALVWYFQQAPSDMGMKAACWSDVHSDSVIQPWPTDKQTKAATRQIGIRAALRQLSPQLQSVLECAYESRTIPIDSAFKYDLAAPLIERAARLVKGKDLEAIVKLAPVLLDAAHRAFRLAYGEPRARTRGARQWARVYRWLDAA